MCMYIYQRPFFLSLSLSLSLAAPVDLSRAYIRATFTMWVVRVLVGDKIFVPKSKTLNNKLPHKKIKNAKKKTRVANNKTNNNNNMGTTTSTLTTTTARSFFGGGRKSSSPSRRRSSSVATPTAAVSTKASENVKGVVFPSAEVVVVVAAKNGTTKRRGSSVRVAASSAEDESAEGGEKEEAKTKTYEEFLANATAMKATEVKEALKALKVPQSPGKKIDLAERLARARVDEQDGKDPLKMYKMRKKEEEEKKEDLTKQLNERRERRRLRSGRMPTTARRMASAAQSSAPGVEDAEFTVANSASVENVLKETFQGEEMTERKRSYARDHLLNSFVNASTSEKAKGSVSGGQSNASSSSEAMWYTIECSEMRENAAMANCLNVPGVIDVWCPRKPPPGFVLAEEETFGRTDLEIRQLIVEGEPIQPGFILAKIANMSQDTIRSLEGEYFVQGLATGGTTSFGKREATRREIAEPIDPGLFESLIRASAPTIVSRAEYDAKIKELMSEMDLSKKEEEETNIYGVKMKKRTERVAELRAENPTEEEQKKEKKKTYDLEIFNGPFKGFHGNVVERLEDGVVRAEVVIFGKTNTVTLESSEYRETSSPSK